MQKSCQLTQRKLFIPFPQEIIKFQHFSKFLDNELLIKAAQKSWTQYCIVIKILVALLQLYFHISLIIHLDI